MPPSFLHRLLSAATLGAAVGAATAIVAPQAVHAQVVAATTSFTLTGVRPEALSWWWDNPDVALLRKANAQVQSLTWLTPPASPQHLGYSAGARLEEVATLGGSARRITTTYRDPQTVRNLVASDNYLGSKPYSFLASEVSIDGKPPMRVLVQYSATGTNFGDTLVRIDVRDTADPVLARAYVDHLSRSLKGLQPLLMDALSERYFNAVFKTRGFYKYGKVDSKLNITLTVVQDIKGITPEMLDWWWDHIGNTERYRLWQPVDHVTFEWTVAPTQPDFKYDIGAVQKVKEYIGKSALTLNITGADPLALPPPTPIVDPGYFYARPT